MPVPDETRDRWSSRAEPDSGTGAIYWHMLFRDDPAARATARTPLNNPDLVDSVVVG